MNLKSLQATQNLTQARNQRRHEQVDDSFRAALTQVSQYTETSDVSLLQDALHKLSATLKLNSTHAESYYLMAYVFYLLDMLPEAHHYLAATLRLKPTLVLAQDLQRHLQDGVFPALQFPDLEQQELDLDTLYDQVEIRIQIKTHEIISMQVPAQASPQAGIRTRLAELEMSLADEYRYLNRQLQQIDQEIEIGELKISLRPFELRLSQIQQLSQHSEQLFAVLQQLQAEQARVQTDLAAPQEAHLETILDHCDLFADQLDELARQNIPISELEPAYQALIEQVTELQDLLEEASFT